LKEYHITVNLNGIKITKLNNCCKNILTLLKILIGNQNHLKLWMKKDLSCFKLTKIYRKEMNKTKKIHKKIYLYKKTFSIPNIIYRN